MSGEANEVLWRGVRPVSGIRGVWPARDAVRVNERDEQVGAGTTILYTVPANKILFFRTAILTCFVNPAAVCAGYIGVRNDLDVNQYHIGIQRFVVAGQLQGGFNFCPALEAAADWDVFIFSSNANLTADGAIHGWLEDA